RKCHPRGPVPAAAGKKRILCSFGQSRSFCSGRRAGGYSMKKFYQTIVNNLKKILACFLLLAAIGAVLSGMVGVNYDIKDYLPDGTASTVSLDVMEEEFKGGIPNARVAVKNVTIPEALEYKEKILSC